MDKQQGFPLVDREYARWATKQLLLGLMRFELQRAKSEEKREKIREYYRRIADMLGVDLES